MYMLPFLALTIIGAVVAWRQNPMYSAGRTIKFIVVFLLAIAAIVLGILAVINLTAGRSQGVQLTAIFSVTGLATIGMILLIIQLSTPSSAALPKGAKLVRFHRAKVDVWAKRAGWTFLAIGLLAIVLPTAGKIMVGTLGAFFGSLAIIMLITGYFSARKMDKWLTEVELRPWAHWTYTPEQWSAWNAVRVQAVEDTPPAVTWHKTGWKMALAIAGIAAGVMLFSPGGWVFKTIYVTGISGLLIGIAALSMHSEKNNGARTARKLSAVAPEVYFGSEGLFVDGDFWPWVSVGIYLLSAAPGQGEPAHLDFQFMKIVGGSNSVVVNQGVLLPAGAEADLAKLQQELTAACPKASVYLV